MTGNERQSTSADVEKFTALWLDCQHTVSAFIRMSVRNLHDVEDLVQDVARDASRNFHQYEQDRPFVSWLIGIARNHTYQYFRKNSREKQLRVSNEVIDTLAEAHVRSAGQANEQLTALRQCMERLPDRQRQLLKMRYERGLNASEIAGHTGATIAGINQLFYRVRKSLADCIAHRMEAR